MKTGQAFFEICKCSPLQFFSSGGLFVVLIAMFLMTGCVTSIANNLEDRLIIGNRYSPHKTPKAPKRISETSDG